MKYMNIEKKYGCLDLQRFADDGGSDDNDNGNGDDSGDDDDKDDSGEKTFTQKDVDELIKDRLKRERRKWKRDADKQKPDGEGNAGDDSGDKEDPKTKELKEKANKADELEQKWLCLEHEADKKCVDDVLALAKVYMAKDDIDIEDAIDEVLKKYPQFKADTKKDDDESNKGNWGQRQKGKGTKVSGVEAAFLKKNPGLKID